MKPLCQIQLRISSFVLFPRYTIGGDFTKPYFQFLGHFSQDVMIRIRDAVAKVVADSYVLESGRRFLIFVFSNTHVHATAEVSARGGDSALTIVGSKPVDNDCHMLCHVQTHTTERGKRDRVDTRPLWWGFLFWSSLLHFALLHA